MYQFTTTERNNEKASEYETKAMLYLFGCRQDSRDMEVFIIDCFNDVSGANRDVNRLWDVQSKGVKSLNPKKIGESLVTLFQNYCSDIEFEHYILFMPKLKEMYLNDEDRTYFQIDNFKLQYIDKIKQGLKCEYERRNGSEPQETDLDNFLQMVEFVIAEEQKQGYIRRITSFRSSLRLEEAFYDGQGKTSKDHGTESDGAGGRQRSDPGRRKHVCNGFTNVNSREEKFSARNELAFFLRKNKEN